MVPPCVPGMKSPASSPSSKMIFFFARSGVFLLMNSRWLRRAENRLLSVGTVLSHVRMMSGIDMDAPIDCA